MGQIQGREPTRYIWPPYQFNCGTRRQRLDARTRNARGIECPLVTRTAHMRLEAVATPGMGTRLDLPTHWPAQLVTCSAAVVAPSVRTTLARDLARTVTSG